MGDVINVHFKRKKHDDHMDDALQYMRGAYKESNLQKLMDLQELLNDEIKENARLRAEISRLKWRLKGEE